MPRFGKTPLDKVRIADLDTPIREKWTGRETPPPVFIVGLHRSGTTILYESIARIMPVAKVTLQNVVFFPRMAHSHIEDGGASDRSALETYFGRHGATNRVVDNIRLSPDTAEEYGWILKRHSGSFRLGEKNLRVFQDLTQKLSFLHPGSRALLFKNPWDTSSTAEVLRLLPNARFIFIRRDPLEILGSEVRNALFFARGRDPLLRLLTARLPQVKAMIGAGRLLYRVSGERAFSRMVAPWLAKDIVNNLHGYQAALHGVPAASMVEITYRQFVDDAAGTLRRLADFLALPVSSEIDAVQPKRRAEGLMPQVAALRESLRREISKEGLESFLDA